MNLQPQFVKSAAKWTQCPEPDRPEYAFIGRSNVGKSSLINMLTQRKALAKTSATPGKTQLINVFSMGSEWYLTDLPGYGYARTSKSKREEFSKMITSYLLERKNLINVFVLIDSRIPPQKIDLEFMQWLGENGIPFSMVFTKTDKISDQAEKKSVQIYETEMLKTWEEMPPVFMTSSENKEGRKELLSYIAELNNKFSGEF